MTLTKAQVLRGVSRVNAYPEEKSAEIVETLLEIIKRTLASGEDILISGFGKFCVKDKRQRLGRNPATGEPLMLKPRKVVTFTRSPVLRDRLNG